MERYTSYDDVKYRDSGEPIPDGHRRLIFAGGDVLTLKFSDFKRFSAGDGFFIAYSLDGTEMHEWNLSFIRKMVTVCNSDYYIMAMEKWEADNPTIHSCGHTEAEHQANPARIVIIDARDQDEG